MLRAVVVNLHAVLLLSRGKSSVSQRRTFTAEQGGSSAALQSPS